MTSENPFSPVFSRAAFLETAGGAEVLRRLDAGLGAREPFLLLTGEPGAGKTTLVHEAIARWDSRVTAAFLAYPALTPKELLEDIVLRFGGEPADGASRPRLMACLERSLTDIAGRGQTAMVVVDAAQSMSPELLDELRMLVNAVQQSRLSLEVLLNGSPELEALIESPKLAALRERLSVRAKLEPLSAGETRRYLRHRVSVVGDSGATVFSRKICLEIAALTGGVPRRINTLAGEALRIARDAGARTIGDEHLRAAREALAGTMPAPAPVEPDDEEMAPAPKATEAAPETRAKAKAPASVPEPSPAPKAIEVVPEAKTPAPAPEPPPAPVTPSAPAAVESTTHPKRRKTDYPEEEAAVTVPDSHDPDEWVQRFVGDQGPIRIGAQVMAARDTGERRRASDAAHPLTLDEAPAAPNERTRPRTSNGNATRVVTYALVAIAMLSTIGLVIRSGGLTNQEEQPVVADSTSAASSDSALAASEASGGAVVTRASRQAASGSVRSADQATENPKRRYTLAVGEVSDLQAAYAERDRIRGLTGMDTWVVAGADSSGPHRIVLGVYRSEERAQKAARMLMDSRTLDGVSVVALPKRSVRQ